MHTTHILKRLITGKLRIKFHALNWLVRPR